MKSIRHTHTQGSLDGLCGIYAIINSCEILLPNGLKDEERGALFCKLVNLLDDGRPIGEIIHEGIGFRKLGELIDVASRTLQHHGIRIDRTVAWKTEEDHKSIDDFWSNISEAINAEAGRIALIGFAGSADHWTVVSRMTDARMHLVDSEGRKQLNKAHCGLSQDDARHQLWPTQTYLLTRRKLEISDD